LAKNNVIISEHLLNNLLIDMQLDSTQLTEDAILVYKNLVDLIEIFQTCPATLKPDRNSSQQFINSLARQPMLKTEAEFGRLD
jgi:hypothetical protein